MEQFLEVGQVANKAEQALALVQRNRCDPAVIEEAKKYVRDAWLSFFKLSFLASRPAGSVRIDEEGPELWRAVREINETTKGGEST